MLDKACSTLNGSAALQWVVQRVLKFPRTALHLVMCSELSNRGADNRNFVTARHWVGPEKTSSVVGISGAPATSR